MSAPVDPREWLYLRVAIAAVALIVVAVVVGSAIDDAIHPGPTRLESTMACLIGRGAVPRAPAGDPLADSAGSGSLKVTIEGNEVTVGIASSQEQAAKIEGYYRDVAGALVGRLERRDRTVYLWARPSSPTQRQAMYDCQY